MPTAPETPVSPADLEAAADQAIAACGGVASEAVKALLVANDFLEAQLDEHRAKISTGYARTTAGGASTKGGSRRLKSPTYVALPFVLSDDAAAPAEAIECFNPEQRGDEGGSLVTQRMLRRRRRL